MLRTLAPLISFRIATVGNPFDLHVLSTPPAFVLSQNQTLRKNLEPEPLLTAGQSLRPSSLTKKELKSDHSKPTSARKQESGSSDLIQN